MVRYTPLRPFVVRVNDTGAAVPRTDSAGAGQPAAGQAGAGQGTQLGRRSEDDAVVGGGAGG